MRNAAARGFEMKAPFYDNLPTQTGDVLVNPINPENPDSKTIRCCALNLYPSPASSYLLYILHEKGVSLENEKIL
jgi:hypothetical protein